MRTYKIDATSGALTQIGLDLPYEGAGRWRMCSEGSVEMDPCAIA